MSWVESIKEFFGVKLFKKLVISSFALMTTAWGLVSYARAATTDFIDQGPGRVVAMYGVPVTVTPPVVKYGPPIMVSPAPSTIPVVPSLPSGFGFSPPWSMPWPYGSPSSLHFTAPTFTQWFPSFPRLLGIATSDAMALLTLVAYTSLLLVAICGWMMSGGAWYLRSEAKKR